MGKIINRRWEKAANCSSHLVNDGVEESPPSGAPVNGSPSARSGLFIELDGANVGFKHWHPVSVAELGNELRGQSDMGGAWEWTSSVLEKHEGYEPMSLYPGYSGEYRNAVRTADSLLTSSADFFDGKHNIVLGGSWATHPRIAGRKSL